MKTHDIEITKIRSMSQSNGLVEAQVEVLVTVARAGQDGASTSTLRMTEADARTLQLLLREQLAAVDKRKARSQR